MAVKAASKTVRQEKETRPRVRFAPHRLPVLLFIVFLIYLLVVTGSQFSRLYALESSVRQAERELKEVRARNAALWERVRLLQSDAYVESLAREKFGLVKPGEVPVVVTVTPQQGGQERRHEGDHNRTGNTH
ncbi:FtsB family cell division protein [Thermodesulfitimonas sp.]